MFRRTLIIMGLVVLLAVMVAPAYAHGDGRLIDRVSMMTGLGGTTLTLGISGVAGLIGGAFAWLVARRLNMSLALVDYAIIVLSVVAGVLHLIVGVDGDWLLLLNGVGFLGLLLLLYLPLAIVDRFRKPVALVIIAYTLVTIVGYFITHDHVDNLGLGSKAVEVLLIATIGWSLLRGTLAHSTLNVQRQAAG